MDPRLQLEIRQLAESWCPTKISDATSWKAGFCAFAELVDCLHKQNSITQQVWLDANTRRNPYTSALDQAIADHQDVQEAASVSCKESIWQDRFGQWHGRG